MLKIGDFSKICQVSVKALRHWNNQGLLIPAKIDPVTGYRYYSASQIRDVNQILSLRIMGLGLEQIKKLLQEDVSTDDIRAMLKFKQAELQQQMEDMEAKLHIIETRLQQIDYKGTLPDYHVSLKATQAEKILSVREIAPNFMYLVERLREVQKYALTQIGTNLLAVFHGMAFQAETIDIEIGFPIGDGSEQAIPLADGKHLQVSYLEAHALVASTVHNGNWDTISNGYIHLGQWIESHDYRIVGVGREIFHHIDWHGEDGKNVTELQFPVTKVSRAVSSS